MRDIKLRLDDSPARAATDKLKSLLAQALEHPFDGALLLRKPLLELRRVDREGGSTVGAGHVDFALEPTQWLLDILAALRAGNADLGVLVAGHADGSVSSSSERDASMGMPGEGNDA
jgi:hypothetical protein